MPSGQYKRGIIKRKPLSQETKLKIGLANKGKVRSLEFRKFLSESQKGRIAWNKGKKLPSLSKEHKEKIRNSVSFGENHASWKGGLTTIMKGIRNSFKYRQWRSDVFQRDDYTCQWCNKRGYIIHADHIKPFSVIIAENKIKTLEMALNCEELWNVNNGRTLCIECHRKTTTYGNREDNWKAKNRFTK